MWRRGDETAVYERNERLVESAFIIYVIGEPTHSSRNIYVTVGTPGVHPPPRHAHAPIFDSVYVRGVATPDYIVVSACAVLNIESAA